MILLLLGTIEVSEILDPTFICGVHAEVVEIGMSYLGSLLLCAVDEIKNLVPLPLADEGTQLGALFHRATDLDLVDLSRVQKRHVLRIKRR